MPNEALLEEITSINAIYDPWTVEVVSEDASNTVTTLLLPAGLSFLVSFPSTYPDAPPHVNGTASVANHTKGEGRAAADLVQEIISRIWTPGQVCLFDLIEEARAQLENEEEEEEYNEDGTSDSQGHEGLEEPRFAAYRSNSGATHLNNNANLVVVDPSSPASLLPPGISAAPNWVLSEPLTVNKSTFLAHSVACNSKAEASGYITHLLSTNKKVAAATHNISAWRLKEPDTGVVVQDSDDDGETAAGGRLLHLMQLMDVWNVLVVVTRWYGGVKLGPERFRCINGVARDVLVKAGYGGKEEKSSKKGKK